MYLEFGDKKLIAKRRKQEACFGFALDIKNAINSYAGAIPANQMGKIMREVGSAMFLDDDINYFCEFQDGIEGKRC